MDKLTEAHDQYKNDLFRKMNFNFIKGKSVLDVGCGDGSDSEIFFKKYGLKTYGTDVYEHDVIKKDRSFLNFKIGSVFDIPFPDGFFDYVFMHDVLHHVDEPEQRRYYHIKALKELKRVVKKDGFVIIVEGNRYNPLFYPHMVLIRNHQHFPQKYFIDIVSEVYPKAEFRFFECHAYPTRFKFIWKFYDYLMDKFSPKSFLSYNLSVIDMAKNGDE